MTAFEQGQTAFQRGVVKTPKATLNFLSNPYPVNSDAHREWQYGFDRAYFSNLETINAS